MEQNKKKKSKFKIPTIGLFAITIVVILYFFPRESKYQLAYFEDRPWQYGLLTAPFNFYVQKSDDKIQVERDQIMQDYQPYYMIDTTVERKGISLFERDAHAQSVGSQYISYISRKMRELYKAGIISAEEYDKVQSQGKKQLFLSNKDHIFNSRHIASFYTAKLAYDKILNDLPEYLDSDILRKINLNDYLSVNILFDEATSDKVKEEMLKEIVLDNGQIQQGEKIIDRGEIVTAHTKEILDSYTSIMESKGESKMKPWWLLIGEFFIISLLVLALFFYMRFYRMREYMQPQSVIFLLVMVAVFPIIMGILMSLKLTNLIYVVPFAVSTILVRTFIDSRTAITTHTITILLCAMMLPTGISTQFVVIQLLIGYTCIFSLRHLTERSQLVYCSAFILGTYIVAYTGWLLATEGSLQLLVDNRRIYANFLINGIFVSFAYLLVYVCERVFGYISEVSMIELSNTNNPLLQRLSEVAPGTFQHVMQVSNLVVPAALRIGANPALVRVGALYHDIGKMTNAAFFTENQTQNMNPHQGLTEKESAKIIIGHVEEGIRIARKHNLPEQIIDFIDTHHGKGKAKYFYNSYVNKHPEEVVDEADFTYPGRNPFSKETALLMMADTIEAASRSLKEYTPESIRTLVDKLIDTQLAEGMFKSAPITFKDIEDAKEVFVDKLVTIYHTRISYPELKKEAKEETNNN